jgi:hypothetical protein
VAISSDKRDKAKSIYRQTTSALLLLAMAILALFLANGLLSEN